MKLTRAYEVLKDEELRKKYDQFGEEGLEDKGFGGGQRYESYNFYRNNFGKCQDLFHKVYMYIKYHLI